MAYVKKKFHLIYPTVFNIPKDIEMGRFDRGNWWTRMGSGRSYKYSRTNVKYISSLKFFKACKFTGKVKSDCGRNKRDYIESVFLEGDMIKRVTVKHTAFYDTKVRKGIIKDEADIS